jgi:hypothetical protein
MIAAGPEGPDRRRSQPQVPIQVGRRFLAALGTIAAAPAFADPHVDLGHVADRPGLDDLDHAAVIVAGMDLRAHLSRHVVLLGGLGNDPGFLDGVRQRLFAIRVHAGANRSDRRRSMIVVGGAHHHGIDLAGFLVDHLAIVGIRAGARKPRRGPIEIILVHVAQGDDVLALNAVDVRRGPIGRTHASDVQLFVRGLGLRRRQLTPHASRNRCEPCTGNFQEVTTTETHLVGHALLPGRILGQTGWIRESLPDAALAGNQRAREGLRRTEFNFADVRLTIRQEVAPAKLNSVRLSPRFAERPWGRDRHFSSLIRTLRYQTGLASSWNPM